MSKSVVVYTSLSCGYCIKLKKFLDENNISFEERDVLASEDAEKEARERSGQIGVPVTVIDDEKVIVGFDEGALKESLQL